MKVEELNLQPILVGASYPIVIGGIIIYSSVRPYKLRGLKFVNILVNVYIVDFKGSFIDFLKIAFRPYTHRVSNSIPHNAHNI